MDALAIPRFRSHLQDAHTWTVAHAVDEQKPDAIRVRLDARVRTLTSEPASVT